MLMRVKRVKNKLRIELPLQKPVPSKSGKTLIVASSHGPHKTGIEFRGKEIVLLLNAVIPARKKPTPRQVTK